MPKFDVEQLVRFSFAAQKIVEPERLLNGGLLYTLPQGKLSLTDEGDFIAFTMDLRAGGLWSCFSDFEITRVSDEGLLDASEEEGHWLNEELVSKVEILEALASTR